MLSVDFTVTNQQLWLPKFHCNKYGTTNSPQPSCSPAITTVINEHLHYFNGGKPAAGWPKFDRNKYGSSISTITLKFMLILQLKDNFGHFRLLPLLALGNPSQFVKLALTPLAET